MRIVNGSNSLLRLPPTQWPLDGRSAAPLREELRDERMFLTRLDRQRRQRERHRQRGVLSQRARSDGTRVGRMGIVDPDRAVDETTELQLPKSCFELHQQPVARWAPAAGAGVAP